MIEIMIVAAIIGLTALIAVPNILGRIPIERMDQEEYRISTDLRWARSEAVSRSTWVEVSFDSALRQYTIWVDSNNNRARDADEERTEAVVAPGLTMTPSANALTFDPSGRLTAATSTFRLTLAHAKADTRYIMVLPSGLIDHITRNPG